MNPTFTLVAVSTCQTSGMIDNDVSRKAKNFVESLPKVLKENLPKEDAEKMKKVFETLGAVVTLE